MKTKRTLVIPLLILLVCIGALLLRRSLDRKPFVKLNDGTVVTLHHVTTGTNHASSSVAKVLPTKWIPARWRPRHFVTTTLSPITILWLEVSGPAWTPYYCTFTDTNGFGSANGPQERVPRGGKFNLVPFVNAPSNTFIAVDFYRRADSAMRMSGYLGRLVMRNPMPKPVMHLRAQAPPIGRSISDGELILERFETLPDGGEKSEKPYPVRAAFKHRLNGTTQTNLIIMEVELTDCVGNVRRLAGLSEMKDGLFYVYGAGLFHPEKGWKLKVKYFHREFARDEIISFSDVPTAHYASKEWSVKTNRNGIEVALTSSRRPRPRMFVATDLFRMPGYMLEAAGKDDLRAKILTIEADGESFLERNNVQEMLVNSMPLIYVRMPREFENRLPPRSVNIKVGFQVAEETEFVVVPKVVEGFAEGGY